nr:MAG TPA: hypothetical protein [Caudoviricetes sp.]
MLHSFYFHWDRRNDRVHTDTLKKIKFSLN